MMNIRAHWQAMAIGLFGFILLNLLTAGFSDARVGRACKLEAAGDLEDANRLYRAVLAEHPEDMASLKGLAVNLMILQRFNEAVRYQRTVILRDPNDAQTRVELAFNLLNHQGLPQEAVRVLREVVALDPSAKHRVFLAQGLIAAGGRAEARDILEEVISTDPGYAHASTVLQKLGNHAVTWREVEHAGK